MNLTLDARGIRSVESCRAKMKQNERRMELRVSFESLSPLRSSSSFETAARRLTRLQPMASDARRTARRAGVALVKAPRAARSESSVGFITTYLPTYDIGCIYTYYFYCFCYYYYYCFCVLLLLLLFFCHISTSLDAFTSIYGTINLNRGHCIEDCEYLIAVTQEDGGTGASAFECSCG